MSQLNACDACRQSELRREGRGYGKGLSVESRMTSRSAGMFFQEKRREMRMKSVGLEAYLRWSLTREMVTEGLKRCFLVFTATEHVVHVTLSQMENECIVTKQWIFNSDTNLEAVGTVLKQQIPEHLKLNVFVPGRHEREQYGAEHLARELTRGRIEMVFGTRGVINMDRFSSLACQHLPRLIGSDTRRWLERLTSISSTPAGFEVESEELSLAEDFLNSSVRRDVAMIYRLLVTPMVKMG